MNVVRGGGLDGFEWNGWSLSGFSFFFLLCFFFRLFMVPLD